MFFFTGSCSSYQHMYMFYSEILASLNFNKNKKKFPRIREQPYTEILFCQFSNIITYVKIVGKILDQYLSVWVFPNLGDKVQIVVESTGQICPVVLQFSGPCPLDLRITIHSNVDLIFFQQFWHLLLCWKIARTTFQCMDVLHLQSRG